MQIYRTTNTINGKWYIGKDTTSNPNYLGSGVLLKKAIAKYGRENFSKEVLEECHTQLELRERERHWIAVTNAQSDPQSYNLVAGGDGGDWTCAKTPAEVLAIYTKRGYQGDHFASARKWLQSCSESERKAWYAGQAAKRCKGWYVSRLDDPQETFVSNLREWCDQQGVDTGAASNIAKIGSSRYGKQLKGWRVRKAGDPPLPPYVNNRNQSRPNDACRGRSWRLVDGKRVWVDKEK